MIGLVITIAVILLGAACAPTADRLRYGHTIKEWWRS